MSRSVALDEKAIDQATAFLADDPDGLRAVLAAIDRLAEHPYPDDAFAFGTTGLHRLRVGRYRVLYSVTDDLISVGHIARAPADHSVPLQMGPLCTKCAATDPARPVGAVGRPVAALDPDRPVLVAEDLGADAVLVAWQVVNPGRAGEIRSSK